jgi:hypothetical protein
VADTERLFDLNREACEEIAERVLQRQAENHGADGGRREDSFLQVERRGHREERDDERVLHDVREFLGNSIDAPRIDRDDDDDVDEAEGEQQRIDDADVPAEIGRNGRVRDESIRRRVRGEQRTGRQQLSADMTVDGRAAQRERDGQENETDNQRNAILEDAMIAALTVQFRPPGEMN